MINYKLRFFASIAFSTSLVSSSAFAQPTDYFSDFEDGSVIKSIGCAVVENDCQLDRVAFVAIVGQEMIAADFETDMSAVDFAQVILGNLRSRSQIELEGETFKFTGITECS